MGKKLKKKVILGMSGGVDSSVAAFLLKERGFEVIGVYLSFIGNKAADAKNYQDAKKVSNVVGIELKRVNAKTEFKKRIIDYFISEYREGRTPNPCVICNPEMKFRVLFEKLAELDADFVATGHYAKIKDGGLFVAKDETKDQSYFLYGLPKKYLKKIIFPLGDYSKKEIKEIAKKMNLPVYEKQESQDVCFISGETKDFLKAHIKSKKGSFVDREGEVVGQHEGVPFYTIGQRKGLNLGGNGPYYVCGKNVEKNEIAITDKENDDMLSKKNVEVKNVNWTCQKPKFPLKSSVKLRYRSESSDATIYAKNQSGKNVEVKFNDPQKAVTPGQSAVFYGKNGEVLGGGEIVN